MYFNLLEDKLHGITSEQPINLNFFKMGIRFEEIGNVVIEVIACVLNKLKAILHAQGKSSSSLRQKRANPPPGPFAQLPHLEPAAASHHPI